MRLKMGLLFVFCILCTIPVLADDNLEEQIRQLSVDVPKQQAELAGRLTAAEEEITLLSQQLGALQQQLVDCEAEQQTSSASLRRLRKACLISNGSLSFCSLQPCKMWRTIRE